MEEPFRCFRINYLSPFALWKFLDWYISPQTPQDRKDILLIISQILAGSALLGGLFFTWLGIKATEENIRISQETATKQLELTHETLKLSQDQETSKHFTVAIQHLGSEKLQIRLGGIYALERIATEAERYHWPIMELLTTYVRENTPWKGAAVVEPEADIQAILTVIGRRKHRYGNGEVERLNFQKVDIRGAILEKAHLEGADLRGAHLEHADLRGAHLEETLLWGSHFEEANLMDSHMQGIYFRGTNLEGTKLYRADLRKIRVSPGANLKRTDWNGAILDGANLSKADLQGANFYGINFKGVKLHEANLKFASLQKADFTEALGITWDQLRSAKTYKCAQLPKYLSEP